MATGKIEAVSYWEASQTLGTSMEEIGKALKSKRTEMNLSLREVENGTSIRMNTLQAIEEGDMTRLISPVYAQGFVKQYASFLGVEVDGLLQEQAHHFQNGPKQDFSYGIGTLEKRPSGGVKNLGTVTWAIAFGGLFFLAWIFAKYMGVL